MVEIIYGKKKNIVDILHIYTRFFSEMAALEPDYLQETDQDIKFLNECVKSKTSEVIIAKKDKETLGFVVVSQSQSPPYNLFKKKTYCYIVDIAVKKESRNLGIGGLLMEEAAKWAKNRDLDYMELNVLHKNIDAKRLYEKLGYEEVMITMRKEI